MNVIKRGKYYLIYIFYDFGILLVYFEDYSIGEGEEGGEGFK